MADQRGSSLAKSRLFWGGNATSPDLARAFKYIMGEPTALGLHLFMGATMPQKIQNIQQQIRQGVLAPLIITASRELAS